MENSGRRNFDLLDIPLKENYIPLEMNMLRVEFNMYSLLTVRKCVIQLTFDTFVDSFITGLSYSSFKSGHEAGCS